MAYLHELCSDRLDVVIKEVRLQVVHTQLKSTQTLQDYNKDIYIAKQQQ